MSPKQTNPNSNPKQRRLGYIAGLFLGRTHKSRMTPRELYRRDFATSTQRLGVRFSDGLRDIFRLRWLRRR